MGCKERNSKAILKEGLFNWEEVEKLLKILSHWLKID